MVLLRNRKTRYSERPRSPPPACLRSSKMRGDEFSPRVPRCRVHLGTVRCCIADISADSDIVFTFFGGIMLGLTGKYSLDIMARHRSSCCWEQRKTPLRDGTLCRRVGASYAPPAPCTIDTSACRRAEVKEGACKRRVVDAVRATE